LHLSLYTIQQVSLSKITQSSSFAESDWSRLAEMFEPYYVMSMT